MLKQSDAKDPEALIVNPKLDDSSPTSKTLTSSDKSKKIEGEEAEI